MMSSVRVTCVSLHPFLRTILVFLFSCR